MKVWLLKRVKNLVAGTSKGRSLNRIMYELGVYGIQSEDYDDCREEIKEYFMEIFNI